MLQQGSKSKMVFILYTTYVFSVIESTGCRHVCMLTTSQVGR